ncbi:MULTISPECIES: amino acid ABC transporter permease [Priestia]|jgi:polar amino acid transport system permease protein|uniref:amino acid ABC transporter permease n=1 Tax=Priestia TaxID=2800373 RepID=UPI000BF96CE3|nr:MULTISPECIES: amino acid ABC transporter permease [Priestia]MCM3153743.1 amino acid ABC transporter permease [Priestia megaterium]MDC7768868.1 amino acid ABC transporter permease [Priestia megaterium]MDH3113363.1 amino acid ABC transporter permease [Priestia aryabhattai]MDH3127731.1 amino acid ABC transporter permease [Priestia aryabhattai]MED4152543.1 amino acid ABC transporter permease [Priestia aryabhattai]
MNDFLSNAREFAPRFLEGTVITVELTIISLILSLIIGLAVALGKITPNKFINKVCGIYISIVRGTPLLVQMMYVYFVFPDLGLSLSAFQAAIVALSINESAYLAETFRAGIKSIPKGQMEAAKAIGMNYSLSMRRIILPQAIKNVIPAIGNSAIVLIKNSSLAAVITVTELMHEGNLLASSTYQNIQIFTMIGIIYWALHYPLAILVDYLEKRGNKNNVTTSQY